MLRSARSLAVATGIGVTLSVVLFHGNARAVNPTSGTGGQIAMSAPALSAGTISIPVTTTAPVDPYFGWNVHLRWNPTLLKFSSFTVGGALPGCGSASTADGDGAGEIVGCTSTSVNSSAAGTLLTFVLTPLAAGCSNLHIFTYNGPDAGTSITGSYTLNDADLVPQSNTYGPDAGVNTTTGAACSVPTATNTAGPTSTRTSTPTVTNTPLATATNTPAPTSTRTSTPTNTPQPSASNTPTPTRTPVPNATSTNTPISGGTATATATPGGEPRDSDGDGYPDQEEIDMGDNPNVYCDTRRADVNDDGFVNTVDLAMLGHHFLEPVPPPTPGYVDPMPTRLDQNRDGMINVIDVAMVGKHFLHDVHECH